MDSVFWFVMYRENAPPSLFHFSLSHSLALSLSLSFAYRLIRDRKYDNKQNVDHCCRDIVQIFDFYWNLLVSNAFHLIWPHNKKHIIRKISIFMPVSSPKKPHLHSNIQIHTHIIRFYLLTKIRYRILSYFATEFFEIG